jgi:poly(A) polymerase
MISFFKRNTTTTPVICTRADHCISRTNIDPDALKVLYRLAEAGYTAYLVGGSVRDLLLGRQPKDFDIGTNAHPNEIRRMFRNCFLIGRRFRLAHIIFGRKIIETSTFRRQPDSNADNGNGLYQMEDNTFGTPEEDAKRRDFTVNGLFYDITTFSVIDYVGGLKDLGKRTLRCIGDPNIRFREDPVRMMRAVKFAARLGFTIDRASCKAIDKYHADILNASPPRVCEEVLRLFGYGTSRAAFTLMWEFKLLQDLLPDLSAYIDASGGKNSPLWAYLDALDAAPDSTDLSNSVRIACLFYPYFSERLRKEETHFHDGRSNWPQIAKSVLHSAVARLHIPKSIFFEAVTLLGASRRFMSPLKDRVDRGERRFFYNSAFPEMLALLRILFAAENRDPAPLKAWQAQREQHLAKYPPPPRPQQHRRGPPDGQNADDAPTDAPDDAAPADGHGMDAAPPSTRHRSRRRRRPHGRRPADGHREAPAP